MQIVLYLARKEKVVSSTELSDRLSISQRYVIQIAGKLRDGNIVTTHVGMSGGYSLCKKASSISVYDIVVLLEGSTYIPDCIKQCNDGILHAALSKSKNYLDAFFKMLTFDQLAEISTTGRLSEVVEVAETHIGIM